MSSCRARSPVKFSAEDPEAAPSVSCRACCGVKTGNLNWVRHEQPTLGQSIGQSPTCARIPPPGCGMSTPLSQVKLESSKVPRCARAGVAYSIPHRIAAPSMIKVSSRPRPIGCSLTFQLLCFRVTMPLFHR